ncbi:hypothetical protein NCS52_00939500 [Fusarium sp. LHS14.1]|nr:hypothetical protein NCS52_00939500 [Fusarium sp. LHS14.1]
MGQKSISLPEAPGTGHNVTPRRQRRFALKVRTGCITCRIRKIKCDEAKPSCHHCTSTGRKCDGYIMPGAALHKPQLSLAQPVPGKLPEERQALYMFRTKIAMSIASSLDLGFWTDDLLRMAEAYTTVQHAVAALATAYCSSIFYENGALQRCLSTPKLTRNHQDIILMVNIVFICICAVQGLQNEACLHLRNGLSLLNEWQLGAEEGHGLESTPTSVKFLATLYTQLDTQARVVMECSFPQKTRLWPPHAVTLDGWGSGHLAIITKAASQLERLHNESIQLTTPSGPSGRENIRHHQYETLHRNLQSWDLDFGGLLCQEGTPIKYLRIRRLLTGVNFELWARNTNKALEPNPNWAGKILELVNEIMQGSRFSEASVVFTPAGGLIEALYFVATRCHDTGLKKVAIEILKRGFILEGLWNSPMAYAALHRYRATW